MIVGIFFGDIAFSLLWFIFFFFFLCMLFTDGIWKIEMVICSGPIVAGLKRYILVGLYRFVLTGCH
jgi:hypothetical protein